MWVMGLGVGRVSMVWQCICIFCVWFFEGVGIVLWGGNCVGNEVGEVGWVLVDLYVVCEIVNQCFIVVVVVYVVGNGYYQNLVFCVCYQQFVVQVVVLIGGGEDELCLGVIIELY